MSDWLELEQQDLRMHTGLSEGYLVTYAPLRWGVLHYLRRTKKVKGVLAYLIWKTLPVTSPLNRP